MNNDFELPEEHGSETTIDDLFNTCPESSSGDVGDIIEAIEPLPEPIKGLNRFSDSASSIFFFYQSRSGFSLIKGIVRSEFRQPPETHWSQNLRYSSYQLRQSIPGLIEREDDTLTANYDDVELWGTGDSVRATISDLYAEIAANYEGLKESVDREDEIPVQNYDRYSVLEYMFLKKITAEVEPLPWQKLKQLYRERLEKIPHVQKGYINIDGNNADVIIVLSEDSVEIIEQLAHIDLEINLQFRPLYFFVEYESSEDYLELDDFDRFY